MRYGERVLDLSHQVNLDQRWPLQFLKIRCPKTILYSKNHPNILVTYYLWRQSMAKINWTSYTHTYIYIIIYRVSNNWIYFLLLFWPYFYVSLLYLQKNYYAAVVDVYSHKYSISLPFFQINSHSLWKYFNSTNWLIATFITKRTNTNW